MSFVERNKTWILPALAVGAMAVVWMNMRTFSETAPPAPVPPPREGSASAATPPITAPAAPPPTPGASDSNLWDDLLPLAVIPVDLSSQEPFERRALTALTVGDLADTVPREAVGRPFSEPGRPQVLPSQAGAIPAVPAPQPDFLITGPAGSRAWFEGRSYGKGQTLHGQPYLVQSIQLDPAPLVRLKGSSGLAIRSTRSDQPSKELP